MSAAGECPAAARASVERMWADYLAALAAGADPAATGLPAGTDPATSYSVWHFGDDQALADSLVELVRSGPKRATAGSLWSYEFEHEPLPKGG